MAVRTFDNERSPRDFLMANLPVIDLSASPSHGTQVIPQFNIGNGLTTQVVMMNITGRELHGRVEFLDASGAPAFVKAGSAYVNTLPYRIAPQGMGKIVITEALEPAVSGSVWIVPADEGPAPAPLAILSYKPGEITISEASVPATMGTAFRFYGELSSSLRISTTVAVANATSRAGTVTMSLTDLEGHFIASGSWNLAPNGQMRASLDSIVPITGPPVRGIVRVTTDLPKIAALGFRERYNERQPAPDFLFTTIPAAPETSGSSQELVFPQVPNGEGFTSEIILYGGTTGTFRGNMIFVQPDRAPFNLHIR
jgi:hypothetical protein